MKNLVAVLPFLVMGGLGLAQRTAPEMATRSVDGPVLYGVYCQVCHGKDGTGNGPSAKELRTPPPDLTRIKSRNKGVFPLARVQSVIDGSAAGPLSHGTREMPIWGPVFSADMGDRDFGKLRVFNLARYLEQMQK